MGGFPEMEPLREPLCLSFFFFLNSTPCAWAPKRGATAPPSVPCAEEPVRHSGRGPPSPSFIDVALHLASISSRSDCHRPRLGCVYLRWIPHSPSVTSPRCRHHDPAERTRLGLHALFSTCPVTSLTHFPPPTPPKTLLFIPDYSVTSQLFQFSVNQFTLKHYYHFLNNFPLRQSHQSLGFGLQRCFFNWAVPSRGPQRKRGISSAGMRFKKKVIFAQIQFGKNQ